MVEADYCFNVLQAVKVSMSLLFLCRKPLNTKELFQCFVDHETKPTETPDPQTKKIAFSAK